MRACVPVRAHQAVEASSQQIHSTHLHRGDLGNIDWRAQVQVEQVTQQVALAGDDVWLVHGGWRSSAHWALPCITAAMGQTAELISDPSPIVIVIQIRFTGANDRSPQMFLDIMQDVTFNLINKFFKFRIADV